MERVPAHSECFRVSGNTSVSLKEVSNGTFVLEVGRVSGDSYEPQRMLVNIDGLLALGALIEPFKIRDN